MQFTSSLFMLKHAALCQSPVTQWTGLAFQIFQMSPVIVTDCFRKHGKLEFSLRKDTFWPHVLHTTVLGCLQGQSMDQASFDYWCGHRDGFYCEINALSTDC